MNSRQLAAPKPISPESHQAVVNRLFSPTKSTALRSASWVDHLESVVDASQSQMKKQRVDRENPKPQVSRFFNLDAVGITIANEWCRLNTREEPFSCVFDELARALISTTYFSGKQFRIVLPISSISHLDLTVPASSDASSTSLLDDLEFPTEMTIHLSGSPLFFIRSAGPFERHIGSSTIDSLGWIRSDDFTNVTGSRLVGGTMIQHKISLNVSLERQEERMGELIRFVHGVTGYLMELENWFMPRFDNHRISPVHYSSPTHSEHSINTAHHSTSDSTASSSRRNSQFSFGSHNSSLHSYTILPTPPPHESSSPIDCQPTEPVAAGKGLGLIVEGTHYQFPSTPVRYTQLPADDHYDSLHPPVVKGRSKSLGDHFTAARRLEDVFEENLHTRRVRATTLDSAAPPLVPFDLLPPIDLDLQESTRRNFKKEKIAGLKSSYDHHRSPSSWLPLPN